MAYQYNPNNPRSSFYWNDWIQDPKLALCSLAAQGLWMRLLCIASKCEPFGYLAVNKRALGLDDLSRMIGYPAQELEPLLHELEENGVFSRNAKGVIYSRRMVRDQRKSSEARKNGKRGGNPSLRKIKRKSSGVKGEDKGGDNLYTSSLNSPLTPQRGANREERKISQRATVWEKRVQAFFQQGVWPPNCGPRPDQEGCDAPAAVVQKYQSNSEGSAAYGG